MTDKLVPPYNRRHAAAVAGTTAGAALAIIAAWQLGADMGTFPSWLTLLAAVGAFASVFLAWRTLVANRENRREDEVLLARLLTPRLVTSYPDDRIVVTVTLRNASHLPFHQIVIEGVTYGDTGCQQTESQRQHERAAPERMYLPAGKDFDSVWVVPDPNTPFDDQDTQVLFRYLDGNGRRWRRYTFTEPERIWPKPSSPDDKEHFNTAMRARKPDGGGVLDPRIWH